MWKKMDFLQAYNKAGETTMTKEKKTKYSYFNI